MIQLSKSEWYAIESPLAEPEERWNRNEKYHIERVVRENGDIIWYGCSVNWKKEIAGYWSVLTTNYEAKPLEKYLPDIVYGEDRTYWKICDVPLYEKMRTEINHAKRSA